MAQVTDTLAGTWVWTNPSGTTRYGEDISCAVSLFFYSVIKRTGTTATICYLYAGTQASPWALLKQVSFVWDLAIFNLVIPAWNYFVVVDNGASNYVAEYGTVSPAYPQVWTNITYVSAGNWNTSQILAIASITTDRNLSWWAFLQFMD